MQAPRATLDKKKSIILGVIGLAFIVLIFWKVIPQIGSYSEAADALRGMGVVSVALIALSVVLYLLAYGLPFMAAAPGLKFWRSQQTNQAAFAISNGIPGGGAVGLAVQFGMLTSFRITPTAATAAITAVGLWSTFVTLGLPILGVAALAISGQGSQTHTAVAVLGLVIRPPLSPCSYLSCAPRDSRPRWGGLVTRSLSLYGDGSKHLHGLIWWDPSPSFALICTGCSKVVGPGSRVLNSRSPSLNS